MRKKIFITAAVTITLLLGTAGVCVLVPGGPAQGPDPAEKGIAGLDPAVVKPSYTLDIDLSWERRTLDVREKVTVVNRTGKNWERLVFSVPPAVDTEVFTLNFVTVSRDHATIQVIPSIRASMLYVQTPQPVPDGATVTVEIDFRLSLKKLGPRSIHPEGNLGYSDQVIQCGDFFPTLTPYEPGRGFREWQYARVGDPYIYPIADFNGSIRTRPDVIVAAAGLVSLKKGEWQFSLENARSFALTASPFYRSEQRTLENGVNITCFFLKGYEQGGQAMLETASQSLELFSELFGPYPYKELVLAHNGYYSAMEYSSFITVTDSYIRNYSPARPQLLLFIIAHEISHQWWYGAVGSDQVAEPWLDEALAKYSEYLYFRAYHPALEQWWLRRLNSVPRLKNHFLDDNLYDFKDDLLTYSRVIYGMSSAFIRKLHLLVGEDAFLAFLKDYYVSGKGRFVTATDFFTVLGRHTDKDITPLLKEFFRRPPNLTVPDEGKYTPY